MTDPAPLTPPPWRHHWTRLGSAPFRACLLAGLILLGLAAIGLITLRQIELHQRRAAIQQLRAISLHLVEVRGRTGAFPEQLPTTQRIHTPEGRWRSFEALMQDPASRQTFVYLPPGRSGSVAAHAGGRRPLLWSPMPLYQGQRLILYDDLAIHSYPH